MSTLSRWQMIRRWLAFFLGKHRAFSDARYFATREVRIEASPEQYIDVDGELTIQTPVTISLAPEALKVIVPQGFDEPWG